MNNGNDVSMELAGSCTPVLCHFILPWWICWDEVPLICPYLFSDEMFWEVTLIFCFYGCWLVYLLRTLDPCKCWWKLWDFIRRLADLILILSILSFACNAFLHFQLIVEGKITLLNFFYAEFSIHGKQ